VPWADRFGAYDFESIMHYPECGFSNCGDLGCSLNPDICRTITVLPAYEEWQSLIGNRSYLSALDGMSMSFLYPQPTWRFVDHTYQGTSTGTFLQPWNSFIIAYASEPSGVTLHLEPGSYLAIGTWSKNLTLKAPLGGVVLGTN